MGIFNDGIANNLIGGLGNQMFIVAAGYLASKYWNCPFYIPGKNNNAHSKEDYVKSIFKYCGIIVPESDSSELLYEAQKFGFNFFGTNETGFREWSPKDLPPKTFSNTFFQYYKPFEDNEKIVRDVFIRGLEYYVKLIKAKYFFNERTTAFVHIRRGDYLKESENFPVIGCEYYSQAENVILEKNSLINKIVVLSDDIEWCRQQEIFKKDIYVILNINNELESMALMSLCKAGAICANSTFSWWGGFLGAHSIRSPVIVPKKWIKNNSNDPIQLFFKEWIQLEYD